MKKLKLKKETISVLGFAGLKQIIGGASTSSPCLNWTSIKATQCDATCGRACDDFTNRCNDPIPPPAN